MNLTKKLSIALFSSFLLFTTASVSAPLSEKIIKQWMSSQSALEEWGDKHESQLEQYESNIETPDDLTTQSMIAPLKASGLYKEANKLVNKYGFNNIEEWADTTLRITKAAAAIEFKNQPELTDMTELETLLKNPQISPEQKAMLTQAIQMNKSMVEKITSGTSDEDMKAVSPLLPQILELMNESR